MAVSRVLRCDTLLCGTAWARRRASRLADSAALDCCCSSQSLLLLQILCQKMEAIKQKKEISPQARNMRLPQSSGAQRRLARKKVKGRRANTMPSQIYTQTYNHIGEHVTPDSDRTTHNGSHRERWMGLPQKQDAAGGTGAEIQQITTDLHHSMQTIKMRPDVHVE